MDYAFLSKEQIIDAHFSQQSISSMNVLIAKSSIWSLAFNMHYSIMHK